MIPSRSASEEVYLLGESPTWDDKAVTARWVDIDRGRMYEAALPTAGHIIPQLAYTTTAPLSAPRAPLTATCFWSRGRRSFTSTRNDRRWARSTSSPRGSTAD